ncbi:hypothetical protein [Streptomyces dysideae]|uniref:YcxB-like protein domain-containing protein n=1 Tax=Streptomyces dysideae TaxID=909626 RepID=A0A101V4B2_9ACTN|nr:hypothetical protein [Streptomyces dysideae]KUO22255.1 hypothetical protein AQJ91_04575 [Streptomyces dysideae]
MIEEQTAEPREDQVVLEYEHQHADLVEGLRTLVRTRGVAALVYRPAFLAVFGLLGLGLLVLDVSHPENFLLPGLMFVGCAVLLYFAPHFTARTTLKAQQHQGLVRVTVNAEGIRATGAHADVHQTWGNFGSYAESDRVFVLRSPDRGGRCAMVLVKRGAAQPADLDRLRTMLDRHLHHV